MPASPSTPHARPRGRAFVVVLAVLASWLLASLAQAEPHDPEEVGIDDASDAPAPEEPVEADPEEADEEADEKGTGPDAGAGEPEGSRGVPLTPGAPVFDPVAPGGTTATTGGGGAGPHGGYSSRSNLCRVCHDLHGASSADGLLVEVNTAAVCMTCHDGSAGPVTGHEDDTQGCSRCHSPHADPADDPKLLRSRAG